MVIPHSQQQLEELIEQYEENLRLLNLRKSEYVLKEDIPLQLIKNEQGLRDELDKLYSQYRSLEHDYRRRVSHSILPWLVDRTDQLFELSRAIARSRADGPRPIVCIIYGDDNECHDKFIDRIGDVTLPNILPAKNDEDFVIRKLLLEWPATFYSMAELHDKLQADLALKVYDFHADKQKINRMLANSPVLIETNLLVHEWADDGRDYVKGFLEFWQNWPSLYPGQLLIICVCIKCVESNRNLLNFWRKSNLPAIIYQVENELADPSVFPFDTYNRIIGAVLPRLNPISWQEAEAWLRMEEVRQNNQYHNLGNIIDQIFERNVTKTISMREFGIKLDRALRMEF